MKILIVEDDEFLRDVYLDTLKSAGYEVETAEDGADGLNKIRRGGYDVVLIDIIIPKLNGLDVIQQTKENPPIEPNDKIIFLTNIDKGEEIERAKTLGDGYIIKSQITPGDLVERVNSYLAKSE